MSYIGDIALGQTFDVKFTTRQISGAPSTLSGSPVISAYVGNGTTEITAGITLSVDFDSRTGLNNVRVVATSGNGFATATDVQLVITAGTVNSVSVFGEVIAEFSIENRQSNVKFWNGTAVATPATAGIPDVNVKNINNTAAATPGASGGVLISGSNSGTTTFGAITCTGSFTISDGLLVSRSSGNTSAITATGNGTGSGAVFTSGSGATGAGMKFVAASTTGQGASFTGAGGGNGIDVTGGGTGAAVKLTGGTFGLQIQGGNNHALSLEAGTSGSALNLTTQAGVGVNITPTGGHGVAIQANGTSKHGVYIFGGSAGTSDGINLNAGTGGVGIRLDTLTASGAVILSSTLAVTGTTTLTGAVSATNASNDIRGITTGTTADSSGVTTLLTRVGGSITISGGIVSADVKKVNNTTVNGDGSGTPWGP